MQGQAPSPPPGLRPARDRPGTHDVAGVCRPPDDGPSRAETSTGETKMTTQKYFYGFRYFGGKSTTTGEPNSRTGSLSHAGEAVVFTTQSALCNWLDREDRSIPSGMGGGIREQVTKKGLRELCLGMSVADFEEYIDGLILESEMQD